ncbi:hypothetical protein [Crossiella sp. CA198]|uniref:hypothetical protein n=1 Tax=Crossiella sp. CA198 TaxID=3455607 RepID=UPI003F8D7CF2
MTTTIETPTATTSDPGTTAAEPVTTTPTTSESPLPAPAPAMASEVSEPSTTAAAGLAATALAEHAETVYRDSLAAGNPLNGRELGARFDRSERWGRDRISAVRASGRGASKTRAGGTRRKTTPAKPAAATAATPVAPSAAETAGAPAVPEATRQPVAAPVSSFAASVAAAETAAATRPRMRTWPVWLLAAPAFVAIWGGWVGLGGMTGFGKINLLPGIWNSLVLNTAITLPIGVEAYAAFALRVWLSNTIRSPRARRFAMCSAIGSLLLGMAGQVAYHLMKAAGVVTAPWPITAFVACLPVVVLGCGAALAHLITHDRPEQEDTPA